MYHGTGPEEGFMNPHTELFLLETLNDFFGSAILFHGLIKDIISMTVRAFSDENGFFPLVALEGLHGLMPFGPDKH